MPHPIIEISELTQLVANHLLLVSPKSLVPFACTYRALEEQALSTLWSEQSSLRILIKSTLPPGVLSSSQLLPQPTRVEWDKFRRYASWMRRLDFRADSWVPGGEVLRMISVNSPDGILCPELRELRWIARPSTMPFYRLFLSPHLTAFWLLFPFLVDQVPGGVLSDLASMIAELPTSSLQSLWIGLHVAELNSAVLKPAVSSTVLRCGPSLTTLFVSVPLSNAALRHVMRLPKLSGWRVMNGPPRVSDLSLSDAFPNSKSWSYAMKHHLNGFLSSRQAHVLLQDRTRTYYHVVDLARSSPFWIFGLTFQLTLL